MRVAIPIKTLCLGETRERQKKNREGDDGNGKEMIRGTRLLPLPILPRALGIFRLMIFV